MTKKLEKVSAISDAMITFVSLVDRPANKRPFCIVKAEDGKATFQTFGKVVKADSHYVTSVVYEPMTVDTDNNYMTAAEIEKAAYWYAENSNKVDIQHSFEPFNDACVVESWIEKADTVINGTEIKEGTWLMTMKINNDDIWDKVQKGEITGFSMGGVGTYSDIDEDIENGVTKISTDDEVVKKSFMAKVLDFIHKGAVKDKYSENSKSECFWNAWYALQSTLSRYSELTGETVFETDEENIQTALNDFTDIACDILIGPTPIAKSLACYDDTVIAKAGRKISTVNREKLQVIYENLGALLKETEVQPENNKPEEEENEEEMNEQEVKKCIDEALEPIKAEIKKSAESAVSSEQIAEIVKSAMGEILKTEESKQETPAEPEMSTEDIIKSEVEKAMKSYIGTPKNLNNVPKVEKQEKSHYMSGFFTNNF